MNGFTTFSELKFHLRWKNKCYICEPNLWKNFKLQKEISQNILDFILLFGHQKVLIVQIGIILFNVDNPVYVAGFCASSATIIKTNKPIFQSQDLKSCRRIHYSGGNFFGKYFI